MKLKRVLACVIIVAAFPLLASQSGNSFDNSVPFASVAFAGHSSMGDYACACGGEGCICDPGETPPGGARNANSTPKKDDGNYAQGTATNSGLDIGTSAMMLALALLVWARFLRT